MKIKSAKHQRRLDQAAMANQAGKILEAESLCRPVVEKYPENFKANLLMAAIYVNHKNYEQALTFCEKANKVKNDPKAVQLLAAIQRRLGHYSESESTLVSDQKAENTRVFFSEQGYNALIQGIFQEAKYYYNLALIIDPYHPMDRFNRATLILAEKDYPLGWKEYEWRFKAGKTEKNYFESIPRWQGEQGQSILVWQEQGVGDTLMFASCLNELL